MTTRITRSIALVAAGLALVAGGGGAYAASRDSSPGPQQEAQALLNDVAKRLGVTPAALTGAVKAALSARVDAAVAAGGLTQAQGDALKANIQSAEVPFFGPGLGLFGPGRFGFVHPGPGHGVELASAATYIGVTQAQLVTELRGGKTLAQVAQAHGKAVSGLVDALVKAEKAELDQAVKNGRLTQAQEDQIVGSLRARITATVQSTLKPGILKPSFRGGPFVPLPQFRS